MGKKIHKKFEWRVKYWKKGHDVRLAPIALFVYNRPSHTRRTIEALQKNKLAQESHLYIFCDQSKNKVDENSVSKVRDFVMSVTGFAKITIIERTENWGLANSIISGVSNVIDEHEKVIVLEDDLISSPCFLSYMNDALNTYERREDIFSVTGYNFPPEKLKIPKNYKESCYLSYRCMSWGWGTWRDRWEKVDWDIRDYNEFSQDENKQKTFNRGGDDLYDMLRTQMDRLIDSWAIRFCYAHYKDNAFCLYPVKSYINNEGFDGSGVHCGISLGNRLSHKQLNQAIISFNKDISQNNEIVERFSKIYRKTIARRIKAYIISLIKKPVRVSRIRILTNKFKRRKK